MTIVAATPAGSMRWTFPNAYSLGIDMRFAVKLYGDAAAYTLAQAWCHRMAYFYFIWVAMGKGRYAFTDADVNAWMQPEALKCVIDSMDEKQKAGSNRLLKLRPRLL